MVQERQKCVGSKWILLIQYLIKLEVVVVDVFTVTVVG
jgi:hypothetical protein